MRHFSSGADEGPRDTQRARGDVALFVEHLDATYNLARWRMRSEAEADDLVQEAYLRAIAHFTDFRGGEGPAWLLTIIRNTCYSRLRRKSTSGQNTDVDDAVHSTAFRQISNPETVMSLAERTELVRKSLMQLPVEYRREILVLRELEQLSYRAIANIEGIPLGDVLSRLSRARRHFQQTLLDSNSPVFALQYSADLARMPAFETFPGRLEQNARRSSMETQIATQTNLRSDACRNS
jgi:RNA polymerase sigma factor (sigma-70 family)